jgi:probable metal-binding protein
MTTTQNIHGHEVLRLLHEANPPLSRVELAVLADRHWGAEARFCTCSAFNMTLAELVGFLMSRGKVVEKNGKLCVDMSQVCGHDGHSHEH